MSEELPLPAGWTRSRMDQVVQPRRERLLPSLHKNMPFIGMDNVEAQTMKLLGTVPAGDMKSSASHFLPGDVLYGRLRPYLNKVVRPGFEGLASAEFIIFPDDPIVSSQYLQYRINAIDFVSFARHLNEGDRPRVDFEQIGKFEITFPPLAEQRRIVARIESLFSKLEAAQAALERARAGLKRYRASLLKSAVEGRLTAEWRAANPPKETGAQLLGRILAERRRRWEERQQEKFKAAKKAPPPGWKDKYPDPKQPDTANLPELPEGWCWATVDMVGDVGGGITINSGRKGDISIPYLRVANVYSNRLDLGEIKSIKVDRTDTRRYLLKKDDILIVEGNGSKDQIGRVAIWDGSIDPCIHQNHLIRVRLQNSLLAMWCNHWLASPYGRAIIETVVSSTSGLHTLSTSKVSSLALPVPPAKELQVIIDKWNELDSLLSKLDAIGLMQKQGLLLRQSILQRAFSGQLVAQDPADEPASALLERIRRTREAAPAPVRKAREPRQKAKR